MNGFLFLEMKIIQTFNAYTFQSNLKARKTDIPKPIYLKKTNYIQPMHVSLFNKFLIFLISSDMLQNVRKMKTL